MKLPDAEEKRLADVAYDAAHLVTSDIGPDWQLIVRAVLAELPECSPEWATPEAKAVLEVMAENWPEKRFNLWEAVHMAIEAWTVSLKPKAVRLPEDWTLLSKNGHVVFVTNDRGAMERARAGSEYRVVEHREAREAPAQ